MRIAILSLFVAVSVFAVHADHISLKPSEIVWGAAPDVLPPGAQAVILEGDPKKPGFFALRLKLPAGYRIAPHYHPKHERVTVLEGSFQLGVGDTFDEGALVDYPAGSYSSMKEGMRHFAMSKNGCVLQLATLGPWGLTYVNPQDDPRRQGAK